MKIRSILAGTALAALALAGGTLGPAGFTLTPQAEAASVNVSFSVFYDDLAQYGAWVRYHDAYVFVPADVDVDWRPYTVGHWVHTKGYGWTWISEEPFGWATYHYGRWGHDRDIGWYWVPGKRWAPAWVSWRRSKDYIVWAPLPPARGGADVSVSISVGDIPADYWVAVPARQFLAPDIHVVVAHEDRNIRRVIDRTEFVGAPRITNNIVVNNVIDVNVVAEATGQKVKTVEVRETDDPRQAKSTGDQVTVFKGEVEADKQAKPKEVRDVSEVKKAKGGKGQTPETTTGETTQPATGTDQSATQPATGDQPTAKTAEEPAATDKLKKKPTAKSDVQDQTPAQATDETSVDSKGKKKKPTAESNGTDQTPAQATDETATGTKDKKKPTAQSDTTEKAAAQTADEPAADAPVKKKDKRGKAAQQETDQPSNDVTGTTTVPADQNAGSEGGQVNGKAKAAKEKPSRKGKAKECDPQTEDCSAQ